MPASKRDQILDGAIECVQSRGVAATTTRDIAAQADASLASIPYHFGSKDALLAEALRVSLTRHADHIAQLVMAEGGSDPRERLVRTLEALIDSFPETRPLNVSLIDAFAGGLQSKEMAADLIEHRRTLQARLAGLIRESLPSGSAGADERRSGVLAVLLLAAIDGLIVQCLYDPERTPSAEQLVDALAAAVEFAVPAD